MRRTGLGHGVYRDSIYPAKSRGDPEKTQNCRQRPRGLVAEAPEGQGSGAQRAEVSPWDSPISLACRGRDMGEAA